MEKQNLNLEYLFKGNVWEYLVGDFLETACFLNPQERGYLIRELQRQNVKAESIDVHPCFSINGKVVIVCEEILPKQCWLFFAKRQQVEIWQQTLPAPSLRENV